jgi:DnaJ-class molecular chaperone
MAADTDAPATPTGADRECMACRGTGQVISTLGGQRRSVECPWCKGTGRQIPGQDAQARWREGGEAEPEAPEPPDEPEPAA